MVTWHHRTFTIIECYFYTSESRSKQVGASTRKGEDPQPQRARKQTLARKVGDLNTLPRFCGDSLVRQPIKKPVGAKGTDGHLFSCRGGNRGPCNPTV